MALVVACLTRPSQWRYNEVAEAMAAGIRRCGDKPFIASVASPLQPADAAVCYGWKHHARYSFYRQFVYADMGYWQRENYYRVAVNGWSAARYVRAGLPSTRFDRLGLRIAPWGEGQEVIVAGSTAKAAADHGFGYMEWERRAIERLKDCGRPVVYRPKPNDAQARAIPGVRTDTRPISESLRAAAGWVTHHSNSAVDALLAGVPVHCEIGAAAAMSVPLDQIANAPWLEGREQFLHDVAWLQWTVDEMRAGECWAHLKERGLVC